MADFMCVYFVTIKKYIKKVQGNRKIDNINTNQKKARVAVFILDKADFRTRKNTRNKIGHYTMVKGSILQVDITMLNMYALNNRMSKNTCGKT